MPITQHLRFQLDYQLHTDSKYKTSQANAGCGMLYIDESVKRLSWPF